MDHELAERVRKLETVNRRLSVALGLMAVCGFVAAICAAADDTPKSIEAERFVVKGPDGKDRASLGMLLDSPQLSLLDDKGETRVSLEVQQNDPTLSFYDSLGTVRLRAQVKGDGSVISVQGKEQKGTIVIATKSTEREDAMILLKNENGDSMLVAGKEGGGIEVRGRGKTARLP